MFESLRAYLYRNNASTTGYAKESLINELSFVCVDLKSYVQYFCNSRSKMTFPVFHQLQNGA